MCTVRSTLVLNKYKLGKQFVKRACMRLWSHCSWVRRYMSVTAKVEPAGRLQLRPAVVSKTLGTPSLILINKLHDLALRAG